MGQTQFYSNRQQQEEEYRKGRIGLAKALLLLLLCLVLVFLITGCAGTLDKAIATCFATDQSPSYTRAGTLEKFSCERQGNYTARAAR